MGGWAEMVPVCVTIEAEIVELELEERALSLADLGLDEPGLNRVVRAGLPPAGLGDLISPPAPRRSAPGPFPGTPAPPKPAALKESRTSS